jgi:hypothetical protein
MSADAVNAANNNLVVSVKGTITYSNSSFYLDEILKDGKELNAPPTDRVSYVWLKTTGELYNGTPFVMPSMYLWPSVLGESYKILYADQSISSTPVNEN